MEVETIGIFLTRAGVRTIIFIKGDDGELADPTAAKMQIKDPDSVIKAGYLSVADSTSFTAGLVVEGAASGAKGLVISKPDGTTLELHQITGVWQSGEVITDTGSGTSTTTSALLHVPMAKLVKGIYHYIYHKGETADPMDTGVWVVDGDVWDGSGAGAIPTPFHRTFTVV